jgi:hypothetical protein
MNDYDMPIIKLELVLLGIVATLTALLLFASCGSQADAEATCWRELNLCKQEQQVLKAELCREGRMEFCEK